MFYKLNTFDAVYHNKDEFVMLLNWLHVIGQDNRRLLKKFYMQNDNLWDWGADREERRMRETLLERLFRELPGAEVHAVASNDFGYWVHGHWVQFEGENDPLAGLVRLFAED